MLRFHPTLASLSLPLLASFHLPAEGGDQSWPHWRGPNQDGLSTESDWVAEGKTEDKWRLNVGLGYSSVTVANGLLYTMGYDEEFELDVIWCLDAETGDEVWAYAYPADIWDNAHRGGTLSTPTIDGEVLFTLNREGNLYAFEAETGEILWHRQVHEEHELTYPTWGYSGSPLVIGDELFVNGGKLLCLDKANGDLKWASKDYGHAYCTPVALDAQGQPALAFLNGDGVAVVARADGAELGFYPLTGTAGISAATPVVVGEGIFVSSSRGGGGALLAFGDEGLAPVWEGRQMTSQMSGCVLMEDHLYGFDLAVLKCVDANGVEKWEQRGIGNGAVSGAPGRLIAMSSRGELIVAEASPEAYTELSRVQLFEDGANWTTPVLVNGLIYCRNNEGDLVCRDHRGS